MGISITFIGISITVMGIAITFIGIPITFYFYLDMRLRWNFVRFSRTNPGFLPYSNIYEPSVHEVNGRSQKMKINSE